MQTVICVCDCVCACVRMKEKIVSEYFLSVYAQRLESVYNFGARLFVVIISVIFGGSKQLFLQA